MFMRSHKSCQLIIPVGTNVADIEIWDVSGAEQLFKRKFMVREVKSVLEVFLVQLFSAMTSHYFPLWAQLKPD